MPDPFRNGDLVKLDAFRRTRAARMACPVCHEPALPRPPRRWVAAYGPHPAWSHVDGEPLCPVVGADGYRPARRGCVLRLSRRTHRPGRRRPHAPNTRRAVTRRAIRRSIGPGPCTAVPLARELQVHRERGCHHILRDEPDWPETCGAVYVTGGSDPYSTECDLIPGHTGRHGGADPLGGAGRVEWSGGGSAGGDPLPYRDVRWMR